MKLVEIARDKEQKTEELINKELSQFYLQSASV
jgi:hypothetical protein